MAPSRDHDASESEFTDVDEEDVPLSQRKDAASKDSNDSGYTIRGVLKVPRATTFTCQALYGTCGTFAICGACLIIQMQNR